MAVTAFSGSLASIELLDDLARARPSRGGVRATLANALARLGPASGARQVFDLLAAPLLQQEGATVAIVEATATAVAAAVPADGVSAVILAACGWNGDLRRLRFSTARAVTGARWWIGTNGVTLRILDVRRAYAQRAVDVDLERAACDDSAAGALRMLLTPGEGRDLDALASLVDRSERHRGDVGRSLQAGVETALLELVNGFAGRRRRAALETVLGDALTVVYRILFLLFAEARGLVPQWHPIYRDSYTIESLRPAAEGRCPPAGLWGSLQAIARLAHRGCTAGSLRVVPFNGRLFAPACAPLADSVMLDDRLVKGVLLAVTTRAGADRRERISYADLGVEQLGSVYERVLEFAPERANGSIVLSPSGRRKRTGTFYTPRAMTEFLVRRTLAPLVRGASPEKILSLRIVDPSMGSGAFLVAACRFLAAAYEEALVADGTVTRADIGPAERAAFRRVVAQRCLYGVDINPTAVQLARLSLWLCTLAAERPLTFLDHHLRCGNSVVGASVADVLSGPPPSKGRRRAPLAAAPLFDASDFAAGLAAAIGTRLAVAHEPDDSAASVHRKERVMERLDGADGPLSAWRTVADAWCAAWFWPETPARPSPRSWPAFAAALRGATGELPPAVESAWRSAAADAAARERFFHWALEFPEVFHDEGGRLRAAGGFDAVVGNPPWAAAGPLTRFSRDSGCYSLQGDGHANLYQLFAERMLSLAAPGGRVGMVVPSGLLTDVGCAGLRARLFDTCALDAVVTFDNHGGVFPIHRGVRFALLTATTAGRTFEVRIRTGMRDAALLDDIPDEGPPGGCVNVPMALLASYGGTARPVPDLPSDRHRAVLARIVGAGPPLGSPAGWNAHFGRELNATDDRASFGTRGLPVLEGKLLEPFRVRVEEATTFIDRREAARRLDDRCAIDRPRLGYREVASSTNRLTLIAAMIPAGTVTTHTIFCLREPLDPDRQWFLCGVFNSYVANYYVRLRGATHVPAAMIHQMPVPVVDDHVVRSIARLARVLGEGADARCAATLQASVARLYGLEHDELAHVLSTFPLIEAAARDAVMRAHTSGI